MSLHSDDDAGYSHSDWGDDPIVLTVNVENAKYLSPTQIALRDGLAPAPAAEGLARQQRLAKMERELADVADFVADCDRYAGFMEHLESPCVHPAVPQMMGRHLDEMRRKALSSGRQLRADISTLRRQG